MNQNRCRKTVSASGIAEREGAGGASRPWAKAQVSGVGGGETTSSRCTITVWVRGWETAAPSVHIWQRTARRRWAWRPRWPACSPSRSGTRRRSRCPSLRRRTWRVQSSGRRGRPAVRQPWWTLQGRGDRETNYDYDYKFIFIFMWNPY